MITDEQAIEFAKELQEYCKEHKYCGNCVMDGYLGCAAGHIPAHWHLSELKNSGDDK